MDAKPTERSYGKNVVLSEGWYSNPSVLTAKSLVNKKADVSQAKRNKATVCGLPSIHLPLTREARVMVRGKGDGARQRIIVLLQWLWEWQYYVQREERAPPLRKARGIVWMCKHISAYRC